MKRVILAALSLIASVALSGHTGFKAALPIATILPGGSESSSVHGTYQPAMTDGALRSGDSCPINAGNSCYGHPSVSRWPDTIPLSERTTPSGSPGQPGYNDNVALGWDDVPFQLYTSSGNYTLNGVNGILICVHADHVSNTPVKWSGSPGSMTSSPNQIIQAKAAIDGGSYVTVTQPGICPFTGLLRYMFFVPMASLADGEHEVRVCAWAAAGYEACLSSVKNVSETYQQPPSGTTTMVQAAAITAGSLNGTTETLTYTGGQAITGYAITSGSLSGTCPGASCLEQVNFTQYPGASGGPGFTGAQLINVKGITNSTWNGTNFAIVSAATGSCSTTCFVTFYNPAATGASGSVAGAAVSDYWAGFIIGQNLVVSGISSSSGNWNTTGAKVTNNICSGPGANQCQVTFTNASASGTYTSGGQASTDRAQFTDPAHHHYAVNIQGDLVAVTGSTDPNILNYSVGPTTSVMQGVYCYNSFLDGVTTTTTQWGKTSVNPSAFELSTAQPNGNGGWGCGSPTETITGITVSGSAPSVIETISYTSSTNYVFPVGDSVQISGVTPGTLNSSSSAFPTAVVTASSCVSTACTVTALVPTAVGPYTSGGSVVDLNTSPNVITQGGTNNMVVTDLDAGTNAPLAFIQTRPKLMSEGSFFFWSNVGGAIQTPVAWVDQVAGVNPSNVIPISTKCTQVAPCQTVDVAAVSLTNTGLASNNISFFGTAGGCLTGTITGINTGATPAAVGTPITINGQNGSSATIALGSTMLANQTYWVQNISSNVVQFSEYPGPNSSTPPPCITDAGTNYSYPTDVIPDLSFATIELECTVPSNCPSTPPPGIPEQFTAGGRPFFSFNGYAINLSWENLICNPGTAITTSAAPGTGSSNGLGRPHIKNCTITTPTYAVATTVDIPPMALVGPAVASPVSWYPLPTPVTGGSVNLGTHTITLNYTDAANKTFQVGSGVAAQLIEVSGISASDWNCSGASQLWTGVAPTTCYVTASSCNGSGSCTMSYFNSAVTSASATVTSAKILNDTVTVSIPSTPYSTPCTSYGTYPGCTPPSGVLISQSLTQAQGAPLVGPPNNFVFYYGSGITGDGGIGTDLVSNLGTLPQSACFNHNNGTDANTYVSNVVTSGGNITGLVLTSDSQTTQGFVNTVDCPVGTPLTFANAQMFPVFSFVADLWSDNSVWWAPENFYPQYGWFGTSAWGVYATDSSFNGAIFGSGYGQTLFQNSIFTNEAGVCWSGTVQIVNGSCNGLSISGQDNLIARKIDPSQPEFYMPFGQRLATVQTGGNSILLNGTSVTTVGPLPPHIMYGQILNLYCYDGGGIGTVAGSAVVSGFNFNTRTVTFTAPLPTSNCVLGAMELGNNIHYDLAFFEFSNHGPQGQLPPNYSAPGVYYENANVYSTLGESYNQGGGFNSLHDFVMKNSRWNLVTNEVAGDEYQLSAGASTNALYINATFGRFNGPYWYISGSNFPTPNNDVYVITDNQGYNVTNIAVAADQQTETVTYSDPNNVVPVVGSYMSVLGAPTTIRLDTVWALPVLSSPAPGCSAGSCHFSFANYYWPPYPYTYTSGGVVHKVTGVNPVNYGANGCATGLNATGSINNNFGGSSSAAGIRVWPADGTWSGAAGANDLTPWYPLNTGTGNGTC